MIFVKQWPVLLATAIVAIVFEQAGVITGWSSPVLAQLQAKDSPIPTTSDEGSWIATAMPLASMLSNSLAALSIHYIGRKWTIALTVPPFIVSWIVIALASTTTELIIARGISGIGMAFTYTAIPVYLAEISPDNIRGATVLCMTAMSNVGILRIYWIGNFPELWRSSLAAAIPILLILVFIWWLPESPYYLISTNQRDRAEKTLQKIRNSKRVDSEVEQIELALSQTGKTGCSFKALFTEANHRRALMICMGMFTFAQFTGSISFVFYVHLIFQKAGNNVSANTMSMIKASLQLVTSVGAAYVVDNVGRKPLLIVSCIGSSIFMFCEGIYFYLQDYGYYVDTIWWLPLTAMILFNMSQLVGLLPISLSYVGELFHPNVKSMAVWISNTYFALTVVIVGKVFQILSDSFGNCVPFFFFAAMAALGLIFVIFVVPETKGRSLEEIQYYMVHKVYRENSNNQP